ncbi:hypothetical protein J6590_016642 [Homalodisca vitripennis]|nr:hypothetical protein J6590_016642 [Homalodisca vitripennis]
MDFVTLEIPDSSQTLVREMLVFSKQHCSHCSGRYSVSAVAYIPGIRSSVPRAQRVAVPEHKHPSVNP